MTPVETLLQRLHNELGFEAERIGPATVARALQSRVEACGLVDPNDYPALIWQDAAEWRAFIDAVIVPESWFMRGPESFALISKLVRQHTWPLPLRCLSLACASGEEPYSLALTLAAAGLTQAQALIDAVDISAKILARAQQGSYSVFALRAVDAAFRTQHFYETPEGQYQLNPEWLAWLRLHQGNIVDDAWQPPNAPYQIIFCRNVLIYLTVPMQRHLMRRLHQWLAPNGVLVVGHAEGSLARQFFRAKGEAQALAFVPRRPTDALAEISLPLLMSTPSTPLPPAPLPPSPATLPLWMQRGSSSAPVSALPQPEPSAPTLEADTGGAPPPPAAAPTLDEARRLADRGAWEEARALCEAWLQSQPQQAEGFFLLGLIAFAQRDWQRAESHWRKAAYLAPEHTLSLRYLSLLKQQQGDTAQAQAWQRRLLRSTAAERSP